MTNQPKTEYGVRERSEALTELEVHAERIRVAGFTVLRGVVSRDETTDLSGRLDAVLQRQITEFGADRLAAIRDDSIARCPLAYDEAFVALAAHPQVLTLCRMLLGDFVLLLQQNGVLLSPDAQHTQAAYHRDLPYQHFVSSRPLAISALFCVDPFTAQTGATMVLPGSHKVEQFLSAAACDSLEQVVEAEPGSFLVFDSMLFHRAGRNRSGAIRRGVNHVYGVPILAQQISIPAAIGPQPTDPALARLLGYETVVPVSVTEWRERRVSRSRSIT